MKKLPFKMIVETDMEKYRHDSYFTKEPETLALIDSFTPGDVFFDVGANIGIYSLTAASKGVEVYAFEPHPFNYIRLVNNILLNGFSTITPLHAAIAKSEGTTTIYVPHSTIGTSGAQLDEPIDEHGKEFEPQVQMSVACFDLDTWVDIINHVKIDVDGHEADIMDGMEICLHRPQLKSVLIECNPNKINISNLIDRMDIYGFTTDNPFNSHPNHSRIRRKKEGIKAENLIFTRKGV